ncbi:MAG: diguanylate cyclase [Planctomycetaceae bacterium]
MDTSRILRSLLDLARDSEQPVVGEEEPNLVVSPWLLRRLLSALHYRDSSTILHSRRVALLAVGIAQQLGWDNLALQKLEVAALLHDIGKVGVPDHILMKPGRLSPDEKELMVTHHHVGIDLLQACRVDREIVDLIWHSHQQSRTNRLDINGNPAESPQGGRILAVADAYDSMRHDQCFRKGKPHSETMRLLRERTGKEFDRNVVAALGRYIEGKADTYLSDDGDAAISVQASAPVDESAIREAGTLCNILGYLHLLESMYDGFYIVDCDMRIIVWNHGMGRLTGTGASDAIGQVWSRNIVRFRDEKLNPLTDTVSPIHRVVFEGTANCGTFKLQTIDKSQMHDVDVHSIPLLDDSGRLQGVAEILRDSSRVRGDRGQYLELQQAARRDPLTGIANRGELESRLGRMFVDRQEGKSMADFSLIFLDIDHFKAVNDTHGHTTGDRVLTDMTRLIEDELYSGEVVSRYGGEEFVIICPEVNGVDAQRRAERLRNCIERTPLGKPTPLRVTASFGVAQVEAGDTAEGLLHRADEALYEAKRTGRNKVCYRAAGNASSTTNDPKSANSRPFFFQRVVKARVAENMVLYKLSGFVDDMQANVTKVSETLIEMTIGKAGLLGGWGSTANRQPVQMTIQIGDPKIDINYGTKHVEMDVQIIPHGRCKDAALFDARANELMQRLRAYCAAE